MGATALRASSLPHPKLLAAIFPVRLRMQNHNTVTCHIVCVTCRPSFPGCKSQEFVARNVFLLSEDKGVLAWAEICAASPVWQLKEPRAKNLLPEHCAPTCWLWQSTNAPEQF